MERRKVRGVSVAPALLVVLVLASSVAWALAPVVILAPAMRAMLARATNAAVAMVGTTGVRASLPAVASIGGVNVAVTASRTSAVADIVAASVGAGVVAVSLGELLEDISCEVSGGSLKCDPGTARQHIEDWVAATVEPRPTLVNDCGSGCVQSYTGEVGPWALTGGVYFVRGHSWTGSNDWGGQSGIKNQFAYCGNGEVKDVRGGSPSCYRGTYEQCPSGSIALQWDGSKCSTPKTSWVTTPVLSALERLSGAGSSADWPAVVQDIADSGVEIAPEKAPVTVVGPATVNLPSTTTTETKSDGTVIQTTKTPVAHITYNGDTITYNISTTTTTTTTAPGGQPQTDTKVETQMPGEGTEPELDHCVKYPRTAGCAELGQAGDEPALEREPVPLVFQPVPFAEAGGCPADIGFTMYGKSYFLAVSPLCDVASWLRPLFLMIGAAGAAFIFMAGFRV